ncbi:MAG: trigger factor [Acidobacteria bacterium]|nr:trigger factor [Acidobacteriota bacterium]
MKTEVMDVGACRKQMTVEIPADRVDRAIDRLSNRYRRTAKLQGFRPGKAPAKVIRTRFRDQILREVAEDLVREAVDEAIDNEEIQPVATPEIRDVEVDEGKPLTFTALFETLPAIDPGDYTAFTLRQSPVNVEGEAIDQAIERLRQRAGRLEPVEGRVAARGDIVTLDLDRRLADSKGGKGSEHLDGVRIEIGSDVNPPRFDAELTGLSVDDARSFTVTHAENDAVERLAGREVTYDIKVTALNQPVLPDVDDTFAQGLGDFADLAALRTRIEEDLKAAAEQDARQEVRGDLLRQLANRVTVDVPTALVERELDRRIEQVVQRMAAEGVDPRKAPVDWQGFREQQRPSATDAVRSTLVLDEIARRESIEANDDDVTREIDRQAKLSGRTPAAARALLEKQGGTARLQSGLRREKAVEFLMSRATIIHA